MGWTEAHREPDVRHIPRGCLITESFRRGQVNEQKIKNDARHETSSFIRLFFFLDFGPCVP